MADGTEAPFELTFPKKLKRNKKDFALAPDYVKWIHGWYCCVRGCTQPWPVHAHHVISVRYSNSDMTCVPLCSHHHTGAKGIHILGRKTWTEEFMVDFEAVIKDLNKKYKNGEKGPMHHRLPPEIKIVRE